MLSSRLFWKLFGVYVLLSAVAVICTTTILSHRQREIVYDQVYQRLHNSAVTVLNLVEESFAVPPAPELIASIASIDSIATENSTRITLIAADGIVVVDSEHDPANMKNHGDRSEVLQAKSTGIGSARRGSPTLGIPMLYLALRAGAEDAPNGYVHVVCAAEYGRRGSCIGAAAGFRHLGGCQPVGGGRSCRGTRLAFGVALYVARWASLSRSQCLGPLRWLAYPGNPIWNE